MIAILFVHLWSLVSVAPLCHNSDSVTINVHNMHQLIVRGGALKQETAPSTHGLSSTANDQRLTCVVE